MAPIPLRAPPGDVRIRFLFAGGWNTLFGYACFVLVHSLAGQALGPFATLVAAYAMALPMAFLTHKHLVFRRQGDTWTQWRRFALSNACIFAANLALVPAVLALTAWPVLLVQAGFIVLSTLASYLAHSRYSFS